MKKADQYASEIEAFGHLAYTQEDTDALVAELRRLAPMESELDLSKRNYENSNNMWLASQSRVKELEDAFLQVRHSITQAKIIGNDWRRELDLISNITNKVLESK